MNDLRKNLELLIAFAKDADVDTIINHIEQIFDEEEYADISNMFQEVTNLLQE